MNRRRGWKCSRKKALPPTNAGGMWALREQYLEDMRARNYAFDTIRMWEADLRRFLTWCEERSLSEPTEVTQPIIERYQRWLYYYRQPNGRPVTFPTQHHMLRAVKGFFRWLTRQHLTLFNPAAEIELPRLGRRLPRDALTAVEAEAVIGQPDIQTALGVRDRAILETLYSTGVRRKELANLSLYDLDQTRGTLTVREGKYRKDRVLPIGRRARAWIEKYVVEVRTGFVIEPDEGWLFLTVDGTAFHRGIHLSEIVKKYIQAANIGKIGSCHIWRHTMATLMLENGADIRFIQEMLGHSDLSTTEVYTHVSIAKLQQIHQATHPAERPLDAAAATDPAAAVDLVEALEREAREEDEKESAPD
jgi:integrase/recombinase XerD